MTKSILCVLLLFQITFCIFGPNDHVYNDVEAREIFELTAAAHSTEPGHCVNRTFPNSALRPEILTRIDVRCDFLTSMCTGLVLKMNDRKQLLVLFRGTQSMTQFFFEGLSLLIPDAPFFDYGHINYYFHVTYTNVWPYLKPYLEDEKYKDYDIIFSGHSLGGSLAALFGFRTIIDGFRNSSQVKIITFAEPRTGNFDFAAAFNKIVEYKFRVVNGIDVLAHVPPCHKDFSFFPSQNLPCDPRSGNGPYHHLREIWYPDGMQPGAVYVVCSGTIGEDSFCSNRNYISVQNFARSLLDHRKYFGVMVSQYGEYGCDRNRTFNEEQGFLGMLGKIANVLKQIF